MSSVIRFKDSKKDAIDVLAEPGILDDIQCESIEFLGTYFMTHGQYGEALTLFKLLQSIAPEEEYYQRAVIYLLLMSEKYTEIESEIDAYREKGNPTIKELGLLDSIQSEVHLAMGEEDQAHTVFMRYLSSVNREMA